MAPFAWQSKKGYSFLLHPKLCLHTSVWHWWTQAEFHQQYCYCCHSLLANKQMRREGNWFHQGHTVSKQQSQDLNLDGRVMGSRLQPMATGSAAIQAASEFWNEGNSGWWLFLSKYWWWDVSHDFVFSSHHYLWNCESACSVSLAEILWLTQWDFRLIY